MPSLSNNSAGEYPFECSGERQGYHSGDGRQPSMPSLLCSSSERESPQNATKRSVIDKRRRQNEAGQTIVTTPWFPQGTVKDSVKLEEETLALGKLLTLTPEEAAVRNRCRSTLQEAVRSLWPGLTVKVYGSFAYGLSLPNSSLDLVCEGCTDISSNLDTFISKLEGFGFKIEGKYCAETEGFVRIRAGDVNANLSLVSGKSLARQSVAAIRSLLEKYPVAVPVFAVVRLLLQQSRCNEAREGGLSSYALLIMVLHTCFRTDPKHADDLLVSFFRSFGTAGDNEVVAARVQESPKPSPDGSLWVEDPLDPTNNVAAGCARLVQIRSVFQTSSMTLQKWSTPRWVGYRGRTPLSSILAYGDLWDRVVLD